MVGLSVIDRGNMVKIDGRVEIQDLVTCEEAAKNLGWGVATIWRRIKDNTIIAVRLSGRTLIPKSEIERLKNSALAQELG